MSLSYYTRVFKSYLSKNFNKTYKVLIWIYVGIEYLIVTLPSELKLHIYDDCHPFLGKLSNEGYSKFDIPQDLIFELSKLFKRSVQKKIIFTGEDANLVEDIFQIIYPEIKLYLGERACLDGINWFVSTKEDAGSISSNWHNDRVGARLKVFICIKGDGSQPTLLIPRKSRIPTFLELLKAWMIEMPRRFGLQNKVVLKNIVKCKHVTGSAYIFDTSLLHRGGYEITTQDRIIFHLEFSTPEKHQIVKGTIGTTVDNEFEFDEKLLTLKIFNDSLDQKRVKKIGVTKYKYCSSNNLI
jgi:hypothetical protein